MLRLVMYLVVLGVLLYAVFWTIDRRNGGRPDQRSAPRSRRPVGPDDDEDFLRDLERKRRHQPPPGPDEPAT